MGRYLFLVDEVPPTKSANGICIDKVIKELARVEEVFCLCYNADIAENKDEYTCVSVPQKRWTLLADKLKKKTGSIWKLVFLFARFVYLVKRLFLLCIWPVDSVKNARDYYRKASELIEEDGISHVVAVCFPGESILAAKWLKRKYGSRIKTMLLPLDVTLEGRYDGTKAERLLSCIGGRHLMRSCAKKADVLFVLENAVRYYNAVFPHPEQDKHILCGIPLLTSKPERLSKEDNTAKDNSKLYIGYAGNLIASLRDPTLLLDMLEQIQVPGKEKIVFDIYGAVDDNLQNSWKNRFSNVEIVMHGWVTEAELEPALQRMDVLLSTGNTQNHLIPSKIFKYMGTDKRIIHLSFSEEDPCIPYLEKYGCALVVNADNSSADFISEMRDFLLKDRKCDIELRKLFPRCTPEYLANKIRNI